MAMRNTLRFEDDVVVSGSTDRDGTGQLDHARRALAFLDIEATEHRRFPTGSLCNACAAIVPWLVLFAIGDWELGLLTPGACLLTPALDGRECDRERRALARRALNRQRATIAFDDRAADAQA